MGYLWGGEVTKFASKKSKICLLPSFGLLNFSHSYTGRKRAHIEKRPKQVRGALLLFCSHRFLPQDPRGALTPFFLFFKNRQKTCTALRSMEELDILVEVLQKDLCESHCSPESRVPTLNLPGAFPELPLPWWEASPQPDGEQMEGSWDSPKLQPWDSFPNSDPPRHTNPKKGHGSGCQTAPQPTKTLLSSCVGGGHWPRGHAVVPTFGEVTPRAHDSTEHVAPASKLEGDATDLQGSREWLKPSTGRSAGQDTSVVSFFQFQLHQEESWLGDLTMDKLLVPNKNGDRSVPPGRDVNGASPLAFFFGCCVFKLIKPGGKSRWKHEVTDNKHSSLPRNWGWLSHEP